MRPDHTPFVAAHLSSALQVASGEGFTLEEARIAHLLAALSHVPRRLQLHSNALRLEFGVRDGRSIRRLAQQNSSTFEVWDGFDSWRGLPSSDTTTPDAAARQRIGWRAGRYTTGGSLPRVPANVRLHSGWFNKSVPSFLEGDSGAPVAFAHFDADLYESTRSPLAELARRCRLVPGTVLAFDELFGSELVEQHEWRALKEVTLCWGIKFRFITYMAHRLTAFGRAAVQITRGSPCCRNTERHAEHPVIPGLVARDDRRAPACLSCNVTV
jgi:hypothetical protein